MNTFEPDQPLLTQYALGELPPHEAAKVDTWLAQSPEARHEMRQIQSVAEALRVQAPLAVHHLNSQQRQRVLQPPARKPQSPAVRPSRPGAPAPQWSFLSFVGKLAAMLTLAATAFWLGQQNAPVPNTVVNAVVFGDAMKSVGPTAPATSVASASASRDQQALQAASVKESTSSVPNPPAAASSQQSTPVKDPAVFLSEKPATPAPEASAPVTTPVLAAPSASPSRSEEPAVVAKPSLPVGMSVAKAQTAFANASRSSNDQVLLHPKQLRPAPPAPKSGQLSAKPLDPAQSASSDRAAERKRPELLIHSWRSEVAACPWNPQHRLLRVTLQLPANQEAVLVGDPEYPLHVQFDPNHVRQFRRLATRNQPSEQLDKAANHTIWYEFQPNGSPAAASENGKHVATIRLQNARFTVQAIGPFDASQLQVLDRGLDWRQARNDFRFETALIGLGLLLDGGTPGAKLDHSLLCEIAASTTETNEDGNRKRLVQSLRQLAEWAGR